MKIQKSKWETRRISDLFKIETGSTPSTRCNEYWNGGVVNWITPTDLSHNEGKVYVSGSERKVTRKALDENNLTLLPKGSLILSTRAPVGYVAVLDNEAVFNQGCKGLIPKLELVPEFYYYCLIAKRRLLENSSSGSTFKELGKDVLEKIEFPFPQVLEQKKIVEILFATDERIELANQKIESIERLRKEMSAQLLGGESQNVGSGWQEYKLGDVCQINPESIDPARVFGDSTFVYIDIDSVENGTGRVISPKTLKGKNAPLRARRITRHKDIVMSTVRPYLKAFAVIPPEYNSAVCSTGFAVLRCGDQIEPFVLLHSLFSKRVIDQCNKMMTGGQYPALNSSQVAEIKLVLPELAEQKRISLKLLDIDNRLSSEKMKKEHLERIKRSQMRSLLSGVKHGGVSI